MKQPHFTAAFLAAATAFALPAAAADDDILAPQVVVTGTVMSSPLVEQTDLKVPRQPLPAHDGADYLKTIPGFSVTRKGGTDGDPILRGMAGSRLNILVDGQNILGGCNFRMDAPTAYIFPEAFDTLTVIKGPQTVLYGPGNSAGTILFEREVREFAEPGYRLYGSALVGGFDRNDQVVDAQIGNRSAYAEISATNSSSDDYEDGDGVAVHSRYHRYSLGAAVGWTPDTNTRLEVSAGYSDGYAAYADRAMDGTKFQRENGGLRFIKKSLSPLVEKIDAQIYESRVDHIMDDQELRTPGMMGYANLKRDTTGGRMVATLRIAAATTLDTGVDMQVNEHSSRMAPPSGIYTPFTDDASFRQYGFMAELRHALNERQRLIAGYRADFWHAEDHRAVITTMMGSVPNPTAGDSRDETLNSGFARLEHQLESSPATLYAGLGHTERFPDYWELISRDGETSASAFETRSEKTNQVDAGVLFRVPNLNVSVSAFASKVDDFILIDYTNPMQMNGASRNIDASTWGGEVGADYAVSSQWKLNTSIAYVRGENDTDGTPLPQLPPLEGRVGLSWDSGVWSAGGIVRLVAAQDRFDLNKGNIVGKDLGPASGFGVFSMNAGWRPEKRFLVTAGVDNVFDRTYAEFVSRAGGNGMGGAIPGYPQTLRVNEPGRTAWLKATISLD